MMRCLPMCRQAHIISDSVIIGEANIICPIGQTSFKKVPFVGRQKRLFCWWGMVDSDHRSKSAADLQSVPFGHSGNPPGANGGTRTRDLLITNQLLYQLSHISNSVFWVLQNPVFCDIINQIPDNGIIISFPRVFVKCF